MLLPDHRAVGDPSARAGPDQKRDIGLAQAHRRQRADVAVESSVTFVIEIHERRVHEDGIRARAAVGVAYQGSLDLHRRTWSPDGVPRGKHKAADIEIELSSVQIRADAAIQRRPRSRRTGNRSGAGADGIGSRVLADASTSPDTTSDLRKNACMSFSK